jgi:phage terminase large subunit
VPQTEINIEAGRIHALTRKAIEGGAKIIIHKGGTGSGKTYDLMIFLLFYMANRNPNWIITIVSESRPHLEIGAIRYAKKLIAQSEMYDLVTYNESKSFYTFPNGSIVEFFSADRIDKALGARRNVLYGNEINSLKEYIWDELARRSDIVIGDFNPTSQFWLERWLTYYADSVIITSNYTFNANLPETERERIKRRAEIDPNFRRIHIDCEYGSADGLVFPSFTQRNEPIDPQTYGLDFGYTNDPTALVAVRIEGDTLYLDEVLYQTGLRNSDIARLALPEVGRLPVYADSSEPKTIDDLYLMGLNVHPVVKGKDSVMWGIDLMKQYNIVVTSRSVNLIKELRNYTYAKDKEGKALNQPIDAFNHAIDAARYAVMMLQRSRHEYKPITTQRNYMTL